MGISQAQDMLRQLQQQMSSPGYGQQFMNQLGQAGLGAQNPANFFGTPFDEQVLRQAVMGRMLGYYGMPNAFGGQYGNVGNPFSLGGSRGMPTDPFSGGMQEQPSWMQGGFGSKKEWKQAGRPDTTQQIGGSGGGIGPDMQLGVMPQMSSQTGGPFYAPPQQGGFGGGGFNDPFYQIMGGYNPQAGALNQDYPGMFGQALNSAMQSAGVTEGGGGFTLPPGFGGFGGGFPSGLPPQANTWLDQLTQGQIGKMNLDYQTQKQDLVDQMFGRGMNASSAAADAAGRLLYGRSEALNQITGMGADRALQLYQTMLENQKGGGGGGINYFGSPFGGAGGFMGNVAQNLSAMGRGSTAQATGEYDPSLGGMGIMGGRGQSPQNYMNILQGMGGGSSPVPLNFEQQMQLAQMQLAQQQLQQQGQLGFGGLGLQRELGLGGLGLQGQGLSQDFMSQLLGMGLSRQQGAAGFNQSDLARMQQYLMGQSGLMAGIGQQNAQMEAQKQSFWRQLALAGIGGASSLLGGMASGGTGFFRPSAPTGG